MGALHNGIVHTLSVLAGASQISLLIALLLVFGIAVGFYCSKTHFSCLVDFDY